MAEPLDSASQLEDVSGVIQQDYFENFEEQYAKLQGRMINGLIAAGEIVGGDGKTMQCEIAPIDSARFDTDALADFADPDNFQEATVKVRFSATTPGSNDFSQVSCSAQVDDITLANGEKGAIVDVADRIYGQLVPNYARTMAIHRHIGRTARLALVNGTPKQNDQIYFSGCAATPTNTTGLRVPVDTGAIAYFRAGMRIDFITSGGITHAGNVRVTDVNMTDKSIGVEFNSAPVQPGRTSTGDLSTVVDNDEIFMSGERNKGLYSVGAYMGRPSTGDSFVGGRDRTNKLYRFLNVTATREGETSRQIRLSDFDDFAVASGFLADGERSGVWSMDATIHQTLRNIIGEDAFIQIPEGDTRLKRFGNFGSIGLNYQHPAWGLVKMVADPFAPPNSVRVIVPETWTALSYGWKGLKFMSTDGGGKWYRMSSSNGTGKTKIWKTDAYALAVDWCYRPWENGTILNVSAT